MTQQIERCCVMESAESLMEVLVKSVVDLSFAQSWNALTSVVKSAARNLAHADGQLSFSMMGPCAITLMKMLSVRFGKESDLQKKAV